METSLRYARDSWSLAPPVTIALILTALVYLRGWFCLRQAFTAAISVWRAVAFVCGVFFLWIAVASPLGELDEELLSVHMVQHLLLMTVTPPLLLLGAPALPFLHGLPRIFSQKVLTPFVRWSVVQRLGRVMTQPVFCWLAATTALLGWHYPAAFALGLESHSVHEVERASFLATGLLFWWPVIRPWPSAEQQARWSIVLYLFLATLPCDALSAFLTFCGHVVYTPYLSAPRLLGVSPLQDQAFAGALMWVSVTFAYLIPTVLLTTQILSRAGAEDARLIAAQQHLRREIQTHP
jgi:cytochrome c oxidase assembly factor CtaG